MALLDLYSVFYFQLKNGVAVPPFAGNCHAFGYCSVVIIDRHFVAADRALYPVHDLVFFLMHYTSPSSDFPLSSAFSRAFCRSSSFRDSGSAYSIFIRL